jgi:hypothetical protein
VHEGEGYAGILIRQGDHGFIHPAPRDQAAEPATEGIRFLPYLRHHRSRPMNQQLPEIAIPSFTDAP